MLAQDKIWSLDDCMRYAVENSPKVKKQVYTHNTYKAERDRSIAAFFPTVSTSVGTQYSFGRSIDQATNTYIGNKTTFNNDYSLSTEIPIFTGGID